jgi:hypothetical protein
MKTETADQFLNDFVNRMIDSAGKNLESVVLFGSAARAGSQEHAADLNLFVTLKSSAPGDLKAIAPVIAWWTNEMHQPSPQIFTAGELAKSADVFAIEFCDMQASHKILFGPDVIAELEIPMNLHRVQVEHELRTTILKLRQLYLHNSGDGKMLGGALAKSLSSVKTLLRHALITLEEPVPGTDAELFARASQVFSVSGDAFAGVARLKTSASSQTDLESTFGEYVAAIETVTRALDGFLPKREWKRLIRKSETRNA